MSTVTVDSAACGGSEVHFCGSETITNSLVPVPRQDGCSTAQAFGGIALQYSQELSVLKANCGFKLDSNFEYSRATLASVNAAQRQSHLGIDT